MKSTPGVNFINKLQAAFTSADPKSAKRQSSHQPKKVGQLLFDCARVKAGHKHVDEINPWSQVHQQITSSYCANFLLPKITDTNVLLVQKCWAKHFCMKKDAH